MNFYSEDIVNDIIDKTDVDKIVDELENFKCMTQYLFLKYTGVHIGQSYVQCIVSDERNKVAFHCIDNEFDIANCPTIMMYNRYSDKATGEIVYYILLICTKAKFKGMGYASKLLNGFIDRVKKETAKYGDTKKVKIALSSVEEAVTFYEEYGFKWTRKSLCDHKPLTLYEKYDETKEYFIMELDIQ
jgi:ribosomal protein S18 acetylase RimI-like enzyme